MILLLLCMLVNYVIELKALIFGNGSSLFFFILLLLRMLVNYVIELKALIFGNGSS